MIILTQSGTVWVRPELKFVKAWFTSGLSYDSRMHFFRIFNWLTDVVNQPFLLRVLAFDSTVCLTFYLLLVYIHDFANVLKAKMALC